MKKYFGHLVGLTAIAISGIAAYMSVTGISLLFSMSLAVIIMAIILEIAKLVSASALYQFWNKISISIKIYLILAITVLMIITSGGIFAYLTDAYSSISAQIQIAQFKLDNLENRKQLLKDELDQQKTRYSNLINQRKSQETQVDSLISRNYITMAKNTNNIINETDNQLVTISKRIEDLNSHISGLDTIKLNIEIESFQRDVGPFIYIAKMLNVSIDVVARFFIFFIVLVFDPLAIALIISYNIIIRKNFVVKSNNGEVDIDEILKK